MDAPARRSITRDELITLGRAGQPWSFLPIGSQALRSLPDDAGLRLLFAANLAQLGLKTPALEELERIAAIPDAAAHPDVAALGSAVRALPDDQVSVAEARATLTRNIRALRATRPHLAQPIADALARWDAARVERFRATDGNVLERVDGQWRSLLDLRALCRSIAAERLSPERLGPLPKPLVIEGLRPPWLLVEALTATPPNAIGYRPRVLALAVDPMEALDALALADVSETLSDPRLHIEIGPHAATKLRDWMRDRSHTQLAGVVLVTPGNTLAQAPSAAEAVTAVVREQEAEHLRLQQRVGEAYAHRTPSWWADRYEAALAGRSEPLRVLIPTSINSTFVRHFASDLAQAFGERGCEARVLIESTNHELLASTAFLRAIDDLRPDAVLMVNHTRRVPLGDLLPAELPVVTWVQDSMPELFTNPASRADGPLDFVVGHLHDEAVRGLAADPERTLAAPVAVSEAKFHDEPLPAAILAEHACEVSMATNHAETPKALVARWLDQQTDPRARQMGELFAARFADWYAAGDGRVVGAVKRFTRQAVEEAFGRRDPEIEASLRFGLGMPLADRVLRHETAEWCAHLARRRGTRFALWGRGWETHPSLGRFARGPAEHGEQLRAIHQASGVHLHVSAHTLMHQRVVESALSGGLPLCRLSDAALAPLRSRMQHELPHTQPVHTDPMGTAHFDPDCTPLTRRYTRLARASRVPSGVILNEALAASIRGGRAEAVPQQLDPSWLIDDLHRLGFAARDQLTRCIERAASDPSWRAAQSAAIAERARRACTLGAQIDPMLKMIARATAAQAKQVGVAA